mgnify:CR=1 FL=1
MEANKNKLFHKFLLLWTGEFISAIGSGLTSFGLGIYVFQVTGKASATALVTLLAFLPSLLLSTVAGVLADRYDRRLLMILGDSLSITGLAFILICIMQGGAEVWHICIGVTISSVFSSLIEPAYKATVTDLLSEEQYTKASGLVQITGSAKYLISPVAAGFLLTMSDIRLLLIIDICTVFVTIASTFAVRSGIQAKSYERKKSFLGEFKDGWNAISRKRGVLVLTVVGTLITFSLGFIQTLILPMLLTITDSSTVGYCETIVATGMLLSSLLIGVLSIKKNYVKTLSLSLALGGVFMALVGVSENLVFICIAGFLFFAMLPFSNASLDYLIRTNIDNSVQGRAWSLIGLISQMGYIGAYAIAGVLADYVFTPLLLEGGALAGSVGKVIGTGAGRGMGLLIIVSGLLLPVISIALYHMKSIRSLEKVTTKMMEIGI